MRILYKPEKSVPIKEMNYRHCYSVFCTCLADFLWAPSHDTGSYKRSSTLLARADTLRVNGDFAKN